MESASSGPCGFCKAPSAAIKCQVCKIIFYCNKKCQAQHSKDHKEACIPTALTENAEYAKYVKQLREFLPEMDRFRDYFDYKTYPDREGAPDWFFIIEHFIDKTAKAKPRDLKLLKTFTEGLVRFFKWDETQNDWQGSVAITPLHWAINRKEIDFVNILPLKMIDMTYGCYFGYTPLILACYHNMVEFTEKILKSKEVKKSAITMSTIGKHELCYTPLLIAVDMGHLKIVELFFKYKEKRSIDLNDPCCKTGYTPLHLLCRNDISRSGPAIGMQCLDSMYNYDIDNSIPMLELFLNNVEEKKIQLFKKDGRREDGLTPFELAISCGQVKIFNVLLEYFEKKGTKVTDHGMNPLIAACKRTEEEDAGWHEKHTKTESERTEIVKLLLQYSKDKGIDLFVKDKLGRSALHHACASGSIKIFDLLIENGLTGINDQDMEGRTPLHHACSIGFKACACSEENPERDPKMLKHLLSKREELGIDVEIREVNSMTPLQALKRFVELEEFQWSKWDKEELLSVFQEYGITNADEELVQESAAKRRKTDENNPDTNDIEEGA